MRSPAAPSCRTASGRRPTTAPTCSATTSAARSSSLTPNGTAATRGRDFATGLGAVVTMTFGPSPQRQALYYTTYADGGQVRRHRFTGQATGRRRRAATASPTSGALPLAVSFDASGSTRSRRRPAHLHLELRRRLAARDDGPRDHPHLHDRGHLHRHPDRARQPRRRLVPRVIRIDAGNTPPQPTITARPPRPLPRRPDDHAARHRHRRRGRRAAPSSLSWLVLRHHDTHTHPFLAPTAGNDVQITQPSPRISVPGSTATSRSS